MVTNMIEKEMIDEKIKIETMHGLKEKVDELYPGTQELQKVAIVIFSHMAFDMVLVNKDDHNIDWTICLMKRVASWVFKNTYIEAVKDSDGEGDRLVFKEKDLKKFFGFEVDIHIPGYA